jgi:mono/diheme cytochrome c family protein
VPANEGGAQVPIPAGEIVEIPDDNLRAEARDTRMPWTAYVPPGTLNRGKQLATKYQCATCHGASLEGIGPCRRWRDARRVTPCGSSST